MKKAEILNKIEDLLSDGPFSIEIYYSGGVLYKILYDCKPGLWFMGGKIFDWTACNKQNIKLHCKDLAEARELGAIIEDPDRVPGSVAPSAWIKNKVII